MDENKTRSKTIKKNVYQKFFAFQTNFYNELTAKGRPNIAKLSKEQECFVYYSDSVIPTEKGSYISSEIHFVDMETGDEITAKSVVFDNPEKGDNTKLSRNFALKALLGYIDNFKGLNDSSGKNPQKEAVKKEQEVKTNAVEKPVNKANASASPTPARTPSEPKGGVPNGFKGFPK